MLMRQLPDFIHNGQVQDTHVALSDRFVVGEQFAHNCEEGCIEFRDEGDGMVGDPLGEGLVDGSQLHEIEDEGLFVFEDHLLDEGEVDELVLLSVPGDEFEEVVADISAHGFEVEPGVESALLLLCVDIMVILCLVVIVIHRVILELPVPHYLFLLVLHVLFNFQILLGLHGIPPRQLLLCGLFGLGVEVVGLVIDAFILVAVQFLIVSAVTSMA
jgi:hypothetical protein